MTHRISVMPSPCRRYGRSTTSVLTCSSSTTIQQEQKAATRPPGRRSTNTWATSDCASSRASISRVHGLVKHRGFELDDLVEIAVVREALDHGVVERAGVIHVERSLAQRLERSRVSSTSGRLT